MFNELILKKINQRDYELYEDLIYENDNHYYIIKKGFITDGASIPSLFKFFFDNFQGNYTKSAILHDILYRTNLIDRKNADNLFLEGMRILNVSIFKRFFLYLGVRAGGWYSYYSNNDDEIKKNKKYIEIKIKKEIK